MRGGKALQSRGRAIRSESLAKRGGQLRRSLAVLSLVSWGLFSCADETPPTLPPPPPVPAQIPLLSIELPEAGEVVERSLLTGQIYRFSVFLEKGSFLEVSAEQERVDVVLSLLRADGQRLLRVDRTDGRLEAEHLLAIVEEEGRFEVEIRACEPKAEGSYRLQTLALRPATARDRRRERAYSAFAQGQESLTTGDLETARSRFADAAQQWQQLGETGLAIMALQEESKRLVELSRRGPAEERLRRALALARQIPSRYQEAETWRLLARLLHQMERDEDERAAWLQARSLFRDLGNASREGEAVNDLAKLDELDMKLGEAEAGYWDAVRLFERAGEEENQARVWRNLGFLEARLGDPEVAIERFRIVRRLNKKLAPEELAQVLEGEALSLRTLGHLTAARAAFQEALEVRRKGLPRDRLFALNGLAQLEFLAHNCDAAMPLFTEAFQISQGIQDRREEAAALQNLATCAWRSGDLEQAEELFQRALSLARQRGAPLSEAAAKSGLARVAADRGDEEEALIWVQQALTQVETFRASSPRPELQTALFADYQGHFDFAIDLLLRRHGDADWSKWADAALEMSERSRTRRLLDVLSLPSRQGRIARPVTRRAIQRELLDEKTALLEIDLSLEKRGIAFLLTKGEQRVLFLPPSADLDRKAKAFYEALKDSGRRDGGRRVEVVASELSVLLLPVIAPWIADKERLLIVPDGALHFIPFELLSWPPGSSAAGKLILETHQVAMAPSSSVAYHLHRLPERTTSKELFLLFDPVFGLDDPRFLEEGPSSPRSPTPGTRSIQDLESTLLPRLGYSGKEAETIRALVPPDQRHEVHGFEARLDLLLGGGLADFERIHLSTHGVFDPRRPEMSGIALTRFDRAGRRLRAFLTPTDIRKLKIQADLVVLSACQTALGKSVPGEGPMSLSHAFFEARARSTLVSLWPVDDEATSRLMESFYRHLKLGLPPSAALQAAKLWLRKEPKWRRPYYWSGFVLQGDGFYTKSSRPGFPLPNPQSPRPRSASVSVGRKGEPVRADQ